jgi:hypothetical protein
MPERGVPAFGVTSESLSNLRSILRAAANVRLLPFSEMPDPLVFAEALSF